MKFVTQRLESERQGLEAIRAQVRRPTAADSKYTRGVVGFVTGSEQYPGAAVLGVVAALNTGVGMVRYLGPERATMLVLSKRPDVVAAAGRVQAMVIGSGVGDDDHRRMQVLRESLDTESLLVLDASGVSLIPHASRPERCVLTPHAGELASLLGVTRDAVEAAPQEHGRRAAERFGAVVVAKGARTFVCSPSRVTAIDLGSPWLAAAGSGDVLAGIIGALFAAGAADGRSAPDDLHDRAVAGVALHGLTARHLSKHAPFGAGELAESLPSVLTRARNLGG
ncbi:NAD(P)H-hydrate dehydratase [Humidisolicoccus flavus]|uniref:NAD(P)H-hydrate dehydratase n=1 Tax=Humidisolicoccus flavus TaxID=3111414 RepID=UPI00324EBD79